MVVLVTFVIVCATHWPTRAVNGIFINSRMLQPLPLHISKLEAVHPEYAHNAPTWRTIRTLIDGYGAIKQNVGKFLPLRPCEDKELYNLRVAKLAYTPIMAGIVNRYIGKFKKAEVILDTTDARILEFRESNAAAKELNRDEKGLLGIIFQHLLQYARVWVTVDNPELDFTPVSQLDEFAIQSELKPYCYLLDPLTVTQWGDGWHIVKQWIELVKPFEQTQYQMSYTYYDKDCTVKYLATVQLADVTDSENNVVPTVVRVKVGDTWLPVTDPNCIIKPAMFGRKANPVYSTVHTSLPDEQWLCKQLYSKQIQHMQLETAWTDTGYIAGTVQRVYTPVDPAPTDDPRRPIETPDYSQELAKAGNAHILIGKGYQFVESSGAAIANQQGMLDKIEQQLNSLAALHFASGATKGALQQSGRSKELDMSLLNDTLASYGSQVVNIYNSVLQLVCYYLGTEPVIATGLKEFQTVDLDTVVALIGVLQSSDNSPPGMLDLLYGRMLDLAKVNTTSTDRQ